MAVHGPDIYLVDSLLPHDLLSFVTVLLRKLLIIQIMQKAGHAPDFLVLALQSGKVGPRRVFAEQRFGCILSAVPRHLLAVTFP